MNKDEWNKTATERNAKAEELGAGIAVGGCLIFVVLILILFVVGLALG
jgi:hypothetical protein